jgi:hypothetical protein
MRWKTATLTGLLLTMGLIMGISARAQETPPSAPPEQPITLKTAGLPPSHPQPAADLPAALRASLGEVSDACENAIPAVLSGDPPYFNTLVDTSVSATSSITDPIQSCTWPAPAVNSKSVWWRVTAPEDGRLRVIALSSYEQPDYDTVVTIYPAAAACGSLSPAVEIGCDDDTDAFGSEASALVDGGGTYLVEVTEWGEAGLGVGDLYLYLDFAPDSHWQSGPAAALRTPLTRHVTVSDGRYLYVLGGQKPALSDKLYRFDPAAGVWDNLAPMPVAYANTDGVYVDGRIYLPSGWAGESGYRGTHYSYAIPENSWSVRDPISSTGQITEPIAWGAAAPDESSAAYYYTGGRYASAIEVPLPYTFRYDVASDDWDALQDMDTARFAHRAAFLNGALYVAGGVGEGGQILASGERYDPGTGSWTPTAELNLPRYRFGDAVGADGRWYIFGGVISGTLTTPKTEVYDPQSDTWTLLDQRWSLKQSREWPAGARVGLSIYAAGGHLSAGERVVDTVEWLNTGSPASYLPLVSSGTAETWADLHEPNNAIPFAYGPLSSGTSLTSNMAQVSDQEDFFYLRTQAAGTLQITLKDIPADTNYELYLYADDKSLLDSSTNVGNADEVVSVESLPAGAYYIRIHKDRSSPPSSEPYLLLVNYTG